MSSRDFVVGNEHDTPHQQVALNSSFQIVLAAMVALSIYLSICLLTFQFMGAGNGVVDGKLVPNSDHWPVAEELMAGNGLTKFFYAPGFSIYIVSAVQAAERWGGTYYFWRLAQDSLSTAVTAALLMSLMRRLSGSLWAGWGAVLALLYNLTYSAGTSADLAMASFMPWFISSVLVFVIAVQGKQVWKRRRAFLGGVLLAISGFIRPDILLFIPFLAIMFSLIRWLAPLRSTDQFIASGRNSRQYVFSTVVLGFSLVLLPWVVYASLRSGTVVVYSTGFVPSHIDGMIRFPGNAVSEAFSLKWPEMDKHHIHQTQVSRETNTLVPGQYSLSEVVRSHFYLFQTYPTNYLRLWAQKVWRPWYASDSSKRNLLLGAQSLLLLSLLLPGIYLWLRRRGVDLGFAVAVGVISYFWLVALVVLSINRYMPPAYPFLGMFIGYGAHVLWLERRFHRKISSVSHTQAG